MRGEKAGSEMRRDGLERDFDRMGRLGLSVFFSISFGEMKYVILREKFILNAF